MTSKSVPREELNEPKRKKKAPLLEQIKNSNLSKVFIGLGACVDPDGLASQLAMYRIIKYVQPTANVDLYYKGNFDRAQNKTMREVLDLNPRPYGELQGVSLEGNFTTPYTTMIMVDGNASAMPKDIKPHFVIDHHDGEPNALVDSDVRLVGSCSSILWEYIMELDSGLLEGEDGAKLATALAIGIITDTDGKTAPKTARLDWEAEAYCGIRSNIKLYGAIKSYQRPAYQKDMEMRAWKNKQTEDGVLTTHLGVIPKERKGILSSCAEEFCRQGSIRTTLIGAMVDGDIHFSFRTFDSSINANEFIQSTITKDGGGRPGAGAGIIKMPEVLKGLPKDIQKELFLSAWKAITHKAFEFTGDGVREDEKGV